ncbi:MlaE family ABC transporter permease [Ramlibacter sp. MAHUQ-53]|uniref:MlaE family ABC transporter permease n=1 Tax=unclassified Ramlibacter TaxID=2617605 RepID=UPI0036267CDE
MTNTAGVRDLRRAVRVPLRWLAGWGRIGWSGALLCALALSPGTWRPAVRHALARHLVLDTAPILAGFTALCALLTLVITRIVVVTAQSYGLSRYALEMVIRVLVLELIPLVAALFVALRCTIPNGAALAALRRARPSGAGRANALDPLALEAVPRMLAGMFSTITLAALSCAVATVLAYFAVYGFTAAGFAGYTRVFGHVFDGPVSLIFALKTALFALAVSVIPMATALQEAPARGSRESAALQGLVRLFAVLLLLEALSLVGNYY